MFEYELYDYILKTNLKIPFLIETNYSEKSPKDIIELIVHTAEDFHNIYTNEQLWTILDFKINLVYLISNENNIIEAFTDDNEKVISSFFNIPLALFAFKHKRFIIHSSSFEKDGYVYGFIGAKGAGKSTLLSVICKKYNFFRMIRF